MADTPADPRPDGPRDFKCDYSLDGTAVHIRPRNDHIWHELDDDCPCGPTSQAPGLDGPVRWIVIHHALDGRAPQGGQYAPDGQPTDNDDPDGYAGTCA